MHRRAAQIAVPLAAPLAVLASVAAAAVGSIAAAQEPQLVATYRDWIVYKVDQGGDTICYAATEPTDKDPARVNHGDVFFTVGTWESGAARNQPSFMAGYDLRDKPSPQVRIGSDRWNMFSADREGFIEDNGQEGRLIQAMRRGSEMRLSAMSERGTQTEYTFSLYGISNALDRAARECR